MSTQEILAELPHLSPEERARVASALHDFTAGLQFVAPPKDVAPPPAFGLHAGAWKVAKNFDDPLLAVTHSALNIPPISVGRVLLSSLADEDLFGEMLEGRA